MQNSPSSRRSEDRPLPVLHPAGEEPYACPAPIDEGYIRIDGKRVEKSSDDVRVGSIVALPLHGHVRVIRVLELPTRRGPAPEAQAYYEEVGIDEANAAS